METLFTKSNYLTSEVLTDNVRSLYENIDWSDRLIGILGARGTGKTTLLLQRLRLNFMPGEAALYITMDDVYFNSNTLLSMAIEFRSKGGKILFIDEVHKYPGWSKEIKNVYDTYKDLQIVFTGSSVIDIYQQEADLSRRAIFYELPGLSFREYLRFTEKFDQRKLSLKEILKDHVSIGLEINKKIRPLQYFGGYLEHGYYPFFTENLTTYFIRVEQVVRVILESELRFIDGFDINNSRKIYQLLSILAQNVPFKPNISKLSDKTLINRNTLVQYLHYLEKARLINMLSARGKSISILQKPDRIYLENPNLHLALAPERANSGSQREAFFLNQLKNAGHSLSLPSHGDFLVDEQWTFEIGGKDKDAGQVKNIKDAYVAADNIETGTLNKIPLWMFGLLY